MKLASGLNGPPQWPFGGTKQKRNQERTSDIYIHIHYAFFLQSWGASLDNRFLVQNYEKAITIFALTTRVIRCLDLDTKFGYFLGLGCCFVMVSRLPIHTHTVIR